MQTSVLLETPLPSVRLILCHKQKTSARLRFLLFPHGVLAFSTLPDGVEISAAPPHRSVEIHPAAWVHQASEQLGLGVHELAAENDFHAEASHEGQVISILLASFTGIDPPFEMAQQHSARFEPITALRFLPGHELTLLRLAYEHLIG